MQKASIRPADGKDSPVSTVLFPFHFLGYIGAGTGSLIIQVVIAALVGGTFALKLYWKRIKAFLKRGEEGEQ
jgi:hypothetical protein